MSSISDYYWHAPLYEPPDFTSREFGIRKNGEKMVRHKAFSSIPKLRTYLIETSPHHVYFSSSKYADPAAYPMEDKKKGWLGSDLVFDIDYDHLKRPTLREAKKQSEKLMLILKDDLGFRKLLYVDSGSRGFHVHVHDECVQKLGNPERREIADFFGHFKTKRGRKIINPNWVEIDTVVTTDFTRLIRLPGSMNVKENSARACIIIKNS
ncbi:MAG TPA: DNA primase small subunit domain-containing protein [Candidatus Methanoperedens sp.]